MGKYKDSQIKAWENIRVQQWAIAQTHELRVRVRMHHGDLEIPPDSSRWHNLKEMEHTLKKLVHYVREEIQELQKQEKRNDQSDHGAAGKVQEAGSPQSSFEFDETLPS
ncbi:MAG: hypothetical protein E6R03_02860 [Hyphomicrobiaceae bacterium]|nr:MAG: hypothetical protein E6R03_02860 [Hyphomicrobiaceae bacterium]